MKKKLLLLSLVSIVFLMLGVLTSCGYIQNWLNGNIVEQDDGGEPPVIVGLETIKAADGYKTSKEYLFNSQGNKPMALTFSEDYYLVIHYNNESKYSISSVKISWKDSNKGQSVTKEFDKKEFAEGSDSSTTYILFSTEDENTLRTGTIDYSVTGVYYVKGVKEQKMKWGEDVSRTISVAVRPYFQLTLNYMDMDRRRGHTKQETVTRTENVYYKTDMKSYVVSPDYEGKTTVPTKAGGWVFAGWYTEPLGQGEFVGSDSTYDFWTDMTLYAYYERMYDIELTDLPQTIVHSYLSAGRETTIEFNTGAVLVNKGKNTQDSVCSNTELEITDTIVIEKYSVNRVTREDGYPGYTVNVTGTEYPVVRIGMNCFKDFNTIITASIGKYVSEIGYCAFRNCTKMETCSFNGGSVLKDLGDYAFEKTEALGRTSPFVLPSTVEYLGMCCFRYSGWGITVNESSGAAGESRLYIPATWKYIGYKCFANTRFERVVFRAGCHFESQVSEEEGGGKGGDESKEGSRTIRTGQNRIGASLFSQCYRLWYVAFESSNGQENGLNIIPDYCFDAGSWWNKSDKDDGDFRCITYISFGEGLKYIGQRAFNYQVKIPELCLPKTLEEVDRYAFYNCVNVTNLNFEHVERNLIDKEGVSKALTDKSKLKIVKSYAFANLTGIDVVYITSQYFKLYGNGVFQGCTRLKCIIFNNIQEEYGIPTGFKSSNTKFGYAGDPRYAGQINDDEVYVGHEMSDMLFGAGEAGDNEASKAEFAMTYSSPIRVFCATGYTNALKGDMLIGKRLSAGSASSGTKSYNSQVFVHPLDNLYEYKYTYDGDEFVVSVAVQEIYKASGGKPTDQALGYSLVYWSARSEHIVLPTATDLNLTGGEIKELAAYALPTSVSYLYIPSCYTRLEHDALNGCMALSTVEFEDINTLTYIGQYAFFGTAIRSFTGGTALKAIGNYAFNRCESLEWVDLYNTPIVNTKNGRIVDYYQYKYEYELEDYDDDFNNCLGNSAFQGCSALRWVRLPEGIKQIRSSTFVNCHALETMIIPTADISDSTDAKDDNCFYEYGKATTIFDPGYLHKIYFYVHSDMTIRHNTILSSEYIGGNSYQILDSAPPHP